MAQIQPRNLTAGHQGFKTGLPFLWHASSVMKKHQVFGLGLKMVGSQFDGRWIDYDSLVQNVVQENPCGLNTAKFVENVSINIDPNKKRSYVKIHLPNKQTFEKASMKTKRLVYRIPNIFTSMTKKLFFDCFSKKKSADIELSDFTRKV